jgi:hypothetical protein
VRQQLERVLRSEAFSRSRRCQEFLSFISQLTIAGEECKINEHMIGIEVFGRGSDYSPGIDGVVRRQAHSLRHRLETYYQTEGKDDLVLIEVPVGHYVPSFRRREIESGRGTAAAAAADPQARARRWSGIFFALGVVALSFFFLGRLTGPARAPLTPPALLELWEPWLTASEGPLICFSSPPVGTVKHFLTPLPKGSMPRRAEIPSDMDAWFRRVLSIGPQGHIYISPDITATKVGEAQGAVILANFFARQGLAPRTTVSRLLTWEEFRRQDIIVLGHNEQNQLVDPLLEGYPLQLEETQGENKRRVTNIDPASGEPAFFEIQYAENEDEATVEYALISMLPGTDHRHQLLVVSGLNTQATLMGIEFLTDASRVENLLGRMRELSPDHAGPWRFQLVVRAEVRDKVPIGGEIEMIRIVN